MVGVEPGEEKLGELHGHGEIENEFRTLHQDDLDRDAEDDSDQLYESRLVARYGAELVAAIVPYAVDRVHRVPKQERRRNVSHGQDDVMEEQ